MHCRAWLAKGMSATAAAVVLVSLPISSASAKGVPTQTDNDFAGYQVSKPAVHVKSATATFVVPTITCKKDFSGVGPSVVVNTAVNKKTNTFTFSGAGVGVGCQSKAPVYQSILVVNGNSTNDLTTLAAGDTVTCTVKMTAAKTTVSVVDVTSGAQKTRTGKGKVGVQAAIGDRSLLIKKLPVGLDTFGKTDFSGAEVNGKPLASEKPVRYTWTRKSTVLVSASKLSKGKDFTVHFHSS